VGEEKLPYIIEHEDGIHSSISILVYNVMLAICGEQNEQQVNMGFNVMAHTF